jgi:hypothetical protein
MRTAVILASALVASCTAKAPKPEDSTTAATQLPNSDSLVMRLPDSVEVWYSGGMLDTAASGASCSERSVEIRRGGSRIPVPLLYTFGAMDVVDDTLVRASLMRDCVPVDTYLINTKTGQPRRVP